MPSPRVLVRKSNGHVQRSALRLSISESPRRPSKNQKSREGLFTVNTGQSKNQKSQEGLFTVNAGQSQAIGLTSNSSIQDGRVIWLSRWAKQGSLDLDPAAKFHGCMFMRKKGGASFLSQGELTRSCWMNPTASKKSKGQKALIKWGPRPTC